MAHQAIPPYRRDALPSCCDRPAAAAFHETLAAPAVTAAGPQVPLALWFPDDLDVAAIKKA